MPPSRTWGGGRGRSRWAITQNGHGFELVAGESRTLAGEELAELRVRRGWWRDSLVGSPLGVRRLGGLRRRDAAELQKALMLQLARHRAAPTLQSAVEWHRQMWNTVSQAVEERVWLTQEWLDYFEATRPDMESLVRLRQLAGNEMHALLTEDEQAAWTSMRADLAKWVGECNEEILQAVAREHAQFFAEVETEPLTDEQIRAVAAFDNRVLVVAAAGSGKTSVMVARAAYALRRGLIAPERILMLAFNRDAAGEMQQRVDARLANLGMKSDGLRASTFHSFGLSVIAAATGAKPRVAPWVEHSGEDVAMVMRIVDDLRDASPEFAYRWDLFRLVYPSLSSTPDGGEPDGWDKTQPEGGFRTAKGELVRSEGERMIADWLFYNGVTYEYERPYSISTADRAHGQYRPDFYYPDVDVWHEHWALDADGNPPERFRNYLSDMQWKQQLHRIHGTRLIETTWASIMSPNGFQELAGRLHNLGVTLDWNPDRKAPGNQPLRHDTLARLVRTFMAHIKANTLSREDVDARVDERVPRGLRDRARLFLQIYWAIHEEWQERLRKDNLVDFEDMLVSAAGYLERGEVPLVHDLIMVDEFQDASQARARMVRALVNAPGKYLLAVGDDWQAINRFAGADISVMTRFTEWFGAGPTLRLQTTFRCPQPIADAASAFVQRNPKQIAKQVSSTQLGQGRITIRFVPSAEATQDEVRATLNDLAEAHRDSRRPTVHVLGRYGFDRQLMPRRVPSGLDVTFRTVHSAKGLEADFVIVPNLGQGRYGFPSNIADDPILGLAMAEPDAYPHAEERRLLYVALTRARRGVTLIAVAGRASSFVEELRTAEEAEVIGEELLAGLQLCPQCDGTLVIRRGPYGEFMGCSNYPRCRYTAPL